MNENEQIEPQESHEEWALRKRRERMKVTRFQAKAALMQAGLLETIEQAVQDADDPLITLAWQEASFDRMSPFIAQMAGAAGLTDEQIDELFDAAKEIG